jgi:hypothetical protein
MKLIGPVTSTTFDVTKDDGRTAKLIVFGDMHNIKAECTMNMFDWFGGDKLPIDEYIAQLVEQAKQTHTSLDVFTESMYISRGRDPDAMHRTISCINDMIAMHLAHSQWGAGLRRVTDRFADFYTKKVRAPNVRFHYSDVRHEPHVQQFFMMVSDVQLCPDPSRLPELRARLDNMFPDFNTLHRLLHAFVLADDFAAACPTGTLRIVKEAIPRGGRRHRIAKQVSKLQNTPYYEAMLRYLQTEFATMQRSFDNNFDEAMFWAAIVFLFDVYTIARVLYYFWQSDGTVVLYAGDIHSQNLVEVVDKLIGYRPTHRASNESGCLTLP